MRPSLFLIAGDGPQRRRGKGSVLFRKPRGSDRNQAFAGRRCARFDWLEDRCHLSALAIFEVVAPASDANQNQNQSGDWQSGNQESGSQFNDSQFTDGAPTTADANNTADNENFGQNDTSVPSPTSSATRPSSVAAAPAARQGSAMDGSSGPAPVGPQDSAGPQGATDPSGQSIEQAGQFSDGSADAPDSPSANAGDAIAGGAPTAAPATSLATNAGGGGSHAANGAVFVKATSTTASVDSGFQIVVSGIGQAESVATGFATSTEDRLNPMLVWNAWSGQLMPSRLDSATRVERAQEVETVDAGEWARWLSGQNEERAGAGELASAAWETISGEAAVIGARLGALLPPNFADGECLELRQAMSRLLEDLDEAGQEFVAMFSTAGSAPWMAGALGAVAAAMVAVRRHRKGGPNRVADEGLPGNSVWLNPRLVDVCFGET